MLKWLKSLFGKDKLPEKISVEVPTKDLEYQKQLHCKLHENYSGATEPVNNCNVCWEIYSQKRVAFR